MDLDIQDIDNAVVLTADWQPTLTIVEQRDQCCPLGPLCVWGVLLFCFFITSWPILHTSDGNIPLLPGGNPKPHAAWTSFFLKLKATSVLVKPSVVHYEASHVIYDDSNAVKLLRFSVLWNRNAPCITQTSSVSHVYILGILPVNFSPMSQNIKIF